MFCKSSFEIGYFVPNVPEIYSLGALATKLAHIPNLILPKNPIIESRAEMEISHRFKSLTSHLANVTGNVEVVDVPDCRVDVSSRELSGMLSIYYCSKRTDTRAGYFYQVVNDEIVCGAVSNPFSETKQAIFSAEDISYGRFAQALAAAERSIELGTNIVAGH